MNIRTAFTKTIATTVAAGALVALTATGASAQTTTTEPAPTSPEQRAAAYVRPAVVALTMEMSGFVQTDMFGKLPAEIDEPIVISGTCSGTVINPNGYVATAGHCVDPSPTTGLGGAFLSTMIDEYWNGGLNRYFDTREEALEYAIVNWRIEGLAAGSAPDLFVSVERGIAVAGVRTGEAMPARVIDFEPIDQGDVALVKVERTGMPSVAIAKNAMVDIGTPVLSVGYPASVASVTDLSLEPTFKDGKISSVRTFNGNTVFEMSAPLSQGMSGGPTVDLDGRIVGVNSYSPRTESQPFNFVSSADLLLGLLARNGVTNETGPVDQKFREGVDAFAKGDYRSARSRFIEVLELAPTHQQSMEWRVKAETMLSSGAGSASDSSGIETTHVAAGLGALVVLAGLGVVVVRRPRGPMVPMEFPATAPAHPAPTHPAPAPLASPTAWVSAPPTAPAAPVHPAPTAPVHPAPTAPPAGWVPTAPVPC